MRRITETELKKYYSEVSGAIVCSHKQKTAFMKELRSNVEEFLTSAPEATVEDIITCFGSPEIIAESFLENADSAKIKKRLDIKKYIIIAIVVALLIYAVFVIISLIDVHTEAHGYFEEGIMMINNACKGWLVL